jgi:hypothetical protein
MADQPSIPEVLRVLGRDKRLTSRDGDGRSPSIMAIVPTSADALAGHDAPVLDARFDGFIRRLVEPPAASSNASCPICRTPRTEFCSYCSPEAERLIVSAMTPPSADARPLPAAVVTAEKSYGPAPPASIPVRCIVCGEDWHPDCRYCWQRLAAFAPRRR